MNVSFGVETTAQMTFEVTLKEIYDGVKMNHEILARYEVIKNG